MASACRSRVVDGHVTTGSGGRRVATIDVEVVERSGVVDDHGTVAGGRWWWYDRHRGCQGCLMMSMMVRSTTNDGHLTTW